MNQVAKKTAASEPPVERRGLPEIQSSHVSVDSEGFESRNILVRAPQGLISDDLRYPRVWRRVQADSRRSLRKLDRLLILAHDESWYCEALAVHCTAAEVKLLIMKTGTFREADQALFSDGTLEIYWSGRGYGVRRVEDQVPVIQQVFTTENQARSALLGWYAKIPA